MATWTDTTHGEKYKVLDNGLITVHAYSITRLVFEKKDNGTPVCLIQLRNPHGKNEWNGAWNDYFGANDWHENPELRKRVNVLCKDSGLDPRLRV